MDPTQATPIFNPSFSTLFGYLNIFAGVMLVISFLLMVGGYVYFIARLGLDGVATGFELMKGGVVLLFVLVVMLGIVRYIQQYTTLTLAILATIVTLWLVVSLPKWLAPPKPPEKK